MKTNIMNYVYAAVIGYFLGCLNSAYIISRAKGFDIRQKGTGNAGASNMVVNLGWAYGAVTAVFDILKSFAAAMLCSWLFPETADIRVFAGTGAIIGHSFPFYMQFKGGKGFASYIGMMAAINWKLALAVIAVGFVITMATGYIAVGTVFVVVLFPLAVWLVMKLPVTTAVLAIVGALIIFWHRKNFRLISQGKEMKLHAFLPKKKKI